MPRLERCLTCLYLKVHIFMFLTQKIKFSMLKLKIFDLNILVEDCEKYLLFPDLI